MVLPAVPAGAHPHVWIDMSVTVAFNDEGEVTGFEHVWTFDEFYTVFQLEELGGQTPTEEQLAQYASDMVESISEFQYLMHVSNADGDIAVTSASDPGARLAGDSRLVLSFTAELDKPVEADPLTYSIYDPEYYIEMLHEKGTGILMSGNPPATCTTSLLKPNPTFEMVSLAASLDRTETGPGTLGAQFAEKVTVDCRPEGDREPS